MKAPVVYKSSVNKTTLVLGKANLPAQVVVTDSGKSRIEISRSTSRRLILKIKSEAKRKELLKELDSQDSRLSRVLAADKIAAFASDKACDAVVKVTEGKHATKFQVTYTVTK
jgi:DNA-directed RNA polymerase subunit H (RpoH/RPB5)